MPAASPSHCHSSMYGQLLAKPPDDPGGLGVRSAPRAKAGGPIQGGPFALIRAGSVADRIRPGLWQEKDGFAPRHKSKGVPTGYGAMALRAG